MLEHYLSTLHIYLIVDFTSGYAAHKDHSESQFSSDTGNHADDR
jgi:hypothetical protein